MAYSLSSPDIKQLKRVLASQLPGASSSRLTEAMARGLELLPVSRTPGLGVLMRTEDADGTTIV